MVRKQKDAFFPDEVIPTIESTEKKIENKKVSYWLEKLYSQRERIRIGNFRHKRSSEIDANIHPGIDPTSTEKDQAIVEAGVDEHTKRVATKIEDDALAIDDLVKKSNRTIISITSIFPWDFFKNTIEVEESRVIFKFDQYLSSQTHSVDIKDISNVFLESSMFFATLQVVSRTFVQNDIKIGKLNIAKAKKVQSIIEGLRTFAENKINTANYEIDELIEKIGEFHSDPQVEA